MSKNYVLLLAVMAFSSINNNVNAQQNNTIEEYSESCMNLQLSDKYCQDSLSAESKSIHQFITWIKNSDCISYKINNNYYFVNAATGKEERLFDYNEYFELITSLLDSTVTYNRDEPRFYIDGVISVKPLILNCRAEGSDFTYNHKKKLFTKKNKEEIKFNKGYINYNGKKYTKDSIYYIYGKNDNIYLGERGNEKQITFDGEPYFSFTTFKSALSDDRPRSIRGDWFRDSHIAYCLRADYRKVREMSVINSVTPIPSVKSYKFELAGDDNVIQYVLTLLYADSAKVKEINITRFKDQEVKLVKNFNQKVEYDAIYFTRKSRTCDTLQLCRVNPYNGELKVLIEETNTPIVNELLHSCSIINGGKEFIWWSERDGKGAYYLYDSNGVLKNRITNGNFVAAEITSIDTLKREFIFAGYGYYPTLNPYHRHYFKVGFNGTGFTQLTPSEGYHDITFSNSKRYILDTYSSIDKYPQIAIRDLKGKIIRNIPLPSDSLLLSKGWKKPIPLKLKAADRTTDLYGVMYLPFNMDSTKKYPLICNVYPGPQTDLLPQKFSLDDNGNSSLAQMGFIVVQIAYRGSSPYRGKDFYTFGHGNLRDYPLEDCKFCVEQLANNYEYIDIDRVGIYGHSGGGFLSAVAIMTYPYLFKVAVSVSGNHDNNIYGKFWGETYNGLTTEIKTDSTTNSTIVKYKSKIATTMELADSLRGRLMLISGEVDDNVHPANTMRLVDVLIKKGKRFDMLIMPRLDHGMYGKYYDNIIKYYFEEHLKNIKPFNIDIINHK